MAIENTTYKKKKNKQWLRYGTTSLIVAMGLGAGATGQAMAAEEPTTTDIDPTSTKTDEDDSQATDSDNRDVDGDGLDDETGQPIPTNPSDPTMVNGSGTTSNPTDGEETTVVAETPADPIVVPVEETAAAEASTDVTADTSTPATTESTTMTPTTVTEVGATAEQHRLLKLRVSLKLVWHRQNRRHRHLVWQQQWQTRRINQLKMQLQQHQNQHSLTQR
ncbi:hypothetical protein [Weissella cibaria]|uniref:hypothetical protein n=1 Tax=Weissella cibaria TaxID=137591 RepID=UPI0005BC4FA6|nr:hypothetical protein [Weissella cibaria]